MKHWANKFQNIRIDELMFYVFAFSIPFQLRTILNAPDAYINYYFSYHLAVFIYISDLLFLTFLFTYLIYNKEDKRIIWPIAIPILWSIINVFHVEQWDLWLYGTLKIAQFWIIIGYLRLKTHLTRPLIYIILASGWFQAILAVIQFHVQHTVGLCFLGEYIPDVLDSGAATINTLDGKLLRAYGTMAHPNVLGGFLATCLALWLYVSRETEKLINWLFVSCGTIVLIFGLVVTFSRSAWTAAFLSAGYIILYTAWKISLKKSLVLAVILIVSCGTSVLIYKTAVYSRIEAPVAENSAVEYRTDFNANAIELIKVHTITGLGSGQYIPWLSETKELQSWQYQPPHNIVLMFLTEMGVIGLLLSLFTAFLLRFTWNNVNMLNVSLFLTIVVLGTFDHYLLNIHTGFLLLALLVGIIITNKKDVSQLRETSN